MLALFIGLLLVAAGLEMLRCELLATRALATSAVGEIERAFRLARIRRRVQVAILFLMIGVLIPVGDLVPVMGKQPALWAIIWLIVLGLTCWIVLLAISDWWFTIRYQHQVLIELQKNRLNFKERLIKFRFAKPFCSGAQLVCAIQAVAHKTGLLSWK